MITVHLLLVYCNISVILNISRAQSGTRQPPYLVSCETGFSVRNFPFQESHLVGHRKLPHMAVGFVHLGPCSIPQVLSYFPFLLENVPNVSTCRNEWAMEMPEVRNICTVFRNLLQRYNGCLMHYTTHQNNCRSNGQ